MKVFPFFKCSFLLEFLWCQSNECQCLVLRITDGGNLNLQLMGPVRERVISKRGAPWLCVTALASSLTDGSSFPLISWLWNTETGKMLQLVWVLDLGVLPPPRGVWKSWEMVLFVTNEWNWSASCYVVGQGHLIVPAAEEFILSYDLFCPKCQCLCWESLDSYWYEKNIYIGKK